MKALVFEEHSSVLRHWWREGVRGGTVVYLDAHLDLQPVNADRLRRLAACRTEEEFAALEKPHALLPDRNFAYSLEDFLYPAFKLGLIRRLVWVAPPHVRTAYSRDVIGQLEQMDGVGPEDLASFRRTGSVITGRLLGLDLIVCDYRDLEALSLPADSLIDIDIDYFVALPEERAWVDPRLVFAALEKLSLDPGAVTISRSVGSGFTPLRYRFVADYLASLFDGRKEEAEHYERLFVLEARLGGGEREAALCALRTESGRHPDCPATWHLLAAAETDAAQALRCRQRAERLSEPYRPDLLRSLCAIRNRRRTLDLATALAFERRANEATAGEGLAQVALGLVYCVFGEVDRAIQCHRRAEAAIGSHPELALEIARLLVPRGRLEDASAFASLALADDKTLTAARALLGWIELAKGNAPGARDWLEEASAAAPAWSDLLEMLAKAHAALGDHGAARVLRQKRARQMKDAEWAARRLSPDPP